MTKDYKSFADYIDRLLEQSQVSEVKHIILAIRGVVVGG
jgi:glucokinase